jgi:hypothetical protein
VTTPFGTMIELPDWSGLRTRRFFRHPSARIAEAWRDYDLIVISLPRAWNERSRPGVCACGDSPNPE